MSLRAQIWKSLAAVLTASCLYSCAAAPEISIANAPNLSGSALGATRGHRIVRFSSYDWLVESKIGGPGPNHFSDSTNNVWLDDRDRLHLRITHRSNQWQCAEIRALRSFGYGSYHFRLASRVDNLNEQAVLGLFTYSGDPAWNNREIDIELGRWANRHDPNNAQFVVQPPASGHKLRFAVPVGQTTSTHSFTWEPDGIAFKSIGAFSKTPGPAFADWRFALEGIPRAGDETVHLNLWLYRGVPPSDGNEVEVIIQSFEFDGG